MSDTTDLTALLLSTLSAIGNISGGLVAKWFEISRDILSFTLHVVAGIILAVIGIELLPPRTLARTRPGASRHSGGFATIATFKSKGVPRWMRLLLSLSFALPIFLGVTVGYWLVRGQPAIVKFSLLAFTAGSC